MAKYHSTASSANMAEVKGHARKIFDAGVKSVLPDQMVKNCLKLHGNTLTVEVRVCKFLKLLYESVWCNRTQPKGSCDSQDITVV